MTKLFAITVMSICLIMSAGFYGIAGADDTIKEQAEEMVNVNKTLDQDAGAAVEEGEKIVDEAEMKDEAEEMVEKHELADEAMKPAENK
jgi:cell division protein FtsX